MPLPRTLTHDWKRDPLLGSWGFRHLGAFRCPSAYLLPWHRHQGAYELTLPLSGEAHWELRDGRRLDVPARACSLTRPTAEHRAGHGAVTPCRLVFVVFAPGEASAGAFPAAGPELERRLLAVADRSAAATPGTVALADALAASLAAEPRDGPRRARILAEAAALVLGVLGDLETGLAPAEHPLRCQIAALLAAARWRLPVGELAGRLGLGRSSLHRRCREELGEAPADLLRRLRLEEARRRLTHGAGDLSRLALDLGFSSAQHFSTAYRRHAGRPPSVERSG